MLSRIFLLVSILLLSACASTGQVLKQSKIDMQEGNYTTAFERLKPLAEKDNADAQYAIGYLYYYGRGTDKDLVQAQKWIRKAASAGQPQAIKAMAILNKPNHTTSTLINYPDTLNLVH